MNTRAWTATLLDALDDAIDARTSAAAACRCARPPRGTRCDTCREHLDRAAGYARLAAILTVTTLWGEAGATDPGAGVALVAAEDDSGGGWEQPELTPAEDDDGGRDRPAAHLMGHQLIPAQDVPVRDGLL